MTAGSAMVYKHDRKTLVRDGRRSCLPFHDTAPSFAVMRTVLAPAPAGRALEPRCDVSVRGFLRVYWPAGPLPGVAAGFTSSSFILSIGY